MRRELTRWIAVCVLILITPILWGCHSSGRETVEVPVHMTLVSTAFSEDSPIPVKFTGQGADVSPDLAWSGAPEATQSYALICEDPDAPGGTWIHWTIWNIPVSVAGMPAGVARKSVLDDGSVQGVTSFGGHGYQGPMPPRGPLHHYTFRIFALDTMLALDASATRQQLDAAMAGHVLAQGTLMGTYQRQ